MRTRIHTITAVTAAALFALTACAISDESVNTRPKVATSKGAETAEEKTDTGTAKKKTAAVGDTITLQGMEEGEQLDVTLKKWLPTAESADEYAGPQRGKKWVAAQFELTNTGSKVYADSPQNGVQVADAEGQRFNSWFGEITAGPEMASDVSLPKGEKALGWIVFEVPKNSKMVTLQFAMNSGFSDETGQWSVK